MVMNKPLEDNPQAVRLKSSDSGGHSHHIGADFTPVDSSHRMADRDKIVRALRKKLENLRQINSAWLEDLNTKMYVYIDASDTGRTTLHSIFDAQYDIEQEYPNWAFHFRVDSLEVENKTRSNQLLRII